MTRSLHPSRYALPGVVVPAQLDYAIRGLVSLALASDDRTKIEVLASDHGLSRKYLAQVLVELRNVGIVSTQRGSDGGYGLARRPAEIRIVDVFDAVSRGQAYEPRPSTDSIAADLTRGAWTSLDAVVREALAGVTLADLMAGPERDGLGTHGHRRRMGVSSTTGSPSEHRALRNGSLNSS
jgi:Rrf2 family iron-sulfur cluster assembly transcriptional regulator